jgi:hypothetical protein
MKNVIALLVTACFASDACTAQIALSGQTGAHVLKSAATESPRAVNSGRPLFGWETVLFLDASVADNVTALITARTSEGSEIGFDHVAIRLTDLTPLHLNIQAGKYDIPFGNLAERRYPRRNPLFGLPLIYEYRSALPNHVTAETDLLSNRGRGTGMRLLNLGMYDLGAMLFGSAGMVEYAFSVTNGTISSISYDGGSSNRDLGKVIRLAITPMTGLTLGGAYAWGAYLDESGSPVVPDGDVNTYVQKAAEFDLEFSRGHFVFYGEGVYNTWPVPLQTRKEHFDVFGYYLEGKYTLLPRLYAALRVGGLYFGKVLLGSGVRTWDYDVTEWEGGLGYFLERDVVVKVVRRESRIQGGSMPKDNLTVLQLAVAY